MGESELSGLDKLDEVGEDELPSFCVSVSCSSIPDCIEGKLDEGESDELDEDDLAEVDEGAAD